MKSSTMNKLRRILWPVAGFLAGVAAVIQSSGDVTTFTWQEILDKALKAAPFVLIGLVGRTALLSPPPVDPKPDDEVESKDAR